MDKPFVEVVWNDASHGMAGWQTEKELPKVSPCINRGWLVKDEGDLVVLAGAYYEEGGEHFYGMTFAIPRGMITLMTELDIA